MRHKRGLVSIIVTNYNNSSYIEACLNSLRTQTYRDVELIVVDDGSRDSSRHVIRRWKEANRSQLRHRMVLLTLPRNVGFAGAVDIGMYLARGEFIAMQDGDDISHPNRISKQVAYMRAHPKTDIVGTNYETFRHRPSGRGTRPNWLAFTPLRVKSIYRSGGHCVSHGTILFKATVFDKLGGPTRRMKGAEDYEMISKCVGSGGTVTNLRDVLYYYRAHAGQRSRSYYRK